MAVASSRAKLLLTLVMLQALWDSAAPACSIDAIYSFGDSIADTGNLLREGPVGFFSSIGSYPYGQTYRKPTGRCSDGLLIIDYFAMALNLPLINPYLDKNADFSGGVNFAVAGATALDRAYLLQNAIIMPPGNTPLSSQLDWFKSHLNDTCQEGEHATISHQKQGLLCSSAYSCSVTHCDISKMAIEIWSTCSYRLWEEAGRSLVLGRGDRRERLQLRVLSEEVHGGRQGVRATGRQEHHGRRKGGDRAGSDPDHHPGELPDRVLAELPLPLLRRRLHGPRRAGLPQELQRLHRVPQRAAPGGHRRPPEGQCRRLRRLRRLLRRVPAPPRPRRRPRVRRGVAAEGVLRRGRGVQLRHGHDVRRARGEHVRRPGTPRELGRHPPHPAGLQGHGAVDPHGRVRPACRKRAGHMELLMIKEARTRCSSTTSLASSSMGCLPSVCLRVANANSNFVSLGKGGYTPALCILVIAVVLLTIHKKHIK